MLNGGSMVWGFCVYFVYMIPLETDVLRKHRFQKCPTLPPCYEMITCVRPSIKYIEQIRTNGIRDPISAC